MDNQSSSENNSGDVLSSVPQISTFEFDKDSIGKIKNAVNLFRGSVNIPVNLVNLPGRDQLDVVIEAIYSSNVKKQVENWNTDAPTGILGLGWEMQFDQIVVNKNNSKSIHTDEYYLVGNGTSNPLIAESISPEGYISFQTKNYEFWEIRYYRNSETWVIKKENGF